MNTITWPSKDIYFSKGVHFFFDEKKQYLINIENYVIVDFKKENLKKIYNPSWILSFPGKRFIIISDKHLIPLANYFYRKFSCVVAVIENKDALKSLFNYFKHGHLEVRRSVRLSDREYFSLNLFIKEYSMRNQAEKLGVNIKTAYTFRAKTAKKMKLSRLIDIFR